jgi:hypothetical protein
MIKARFTARFSKFAFLCMMVVAMAGLLPFPAFAQAIATNLQGAASQVASQSSILAGFIAMVSYVIGAAFAVRSLFALRRHIESADEHPLGPVLGYCTAAALLIMLPYSIGLTQKTMGIGDETGMASTTLTSTADKFSQSPSCTASANIGAVFCNLVKNFSPFASMLAVISYVMSAILTLTGLLNLKAYGDDPSQTPLRSILVKFALAAMLLSLPLAMQVFVTSVTGAQSISTTVTVKKPSLYSGTLR